VARRYASALADVVLSGGEAREIREELVGWESLIQSSELFQEVLSNPTIAYEQKRTVLEEMIKRTKIHQATANFLRILLRNRRLTDLGEINRRFALVLDERSGVVAAEVTTARSVSDEIKQAISRKLATMTGREVRFNFATDETIIGGMITRIGSTVYDGSVRNQLRQVEGRLAGK
jgi:F-type H+-transporting ATPase subunit delta